MRDGAALVEDEPRPHATSYQLVDGCLGRRAGDLLVAAEGQPEVLCRPVTGCEESFDRLTDGGDAALVVEGAAAPHGAVDDLGREGRVLPGRRLVDRYDVEVRHQHDRTVAARAGPTEEQTVAADTGELQLLVEQGELRLELGQQPVEGVGVDT